MLGSIGPPLRFAVQPDYKETCDLLLPGEISMPRYFFNTRIGDELVSDPEGAELRDPDHAWEMARTTIREILASGHDNTELLRAIMEVTDAQGEIVMEFPFAEAIIDSPERSETRH